MAVAIGRRSDFMMLFVFFFVSTIDLENGADAASVPFDFVYRAATKTGDLKRSQRSNVSVVDVTDNNPPPSPPIDRDRSLTSSRVENANANRIQTLFQLLEHRPEQQSCYNGRSDRTFRFFCPTPVPEDLENGWQCITIDDLCNSIPDCPGAEDEDLTHCMFYMAIQHQTQTLRQIIVRHYEQVHTVPNTVRT